MTEDKGYVYLARPIDFFDARGDQIRVQMEIEETLAKAGYSVYHPAYAWKVNGPLTEDLARCIASSNRFALRRAAAVAAWLPKGVQTQGVPMEIQFAARELGIPVIVIGEVGAMILGDPLISVLPEAEVEKIGRQLDLMVPDFTARNNPVIRYSGPPDGWQLDHAHPGDAGVDLRASEDVLLQPGEQAFVPSGVKIALPHGMFGWIVARSSTFGVHGLLVLPGIIDQEYQGELGISCVNLTKLPHRVRQGDRLGQLLLLANMWPGFALRKTDEENVFPHPTSRGAAGFGSSGR